MYVDDTTLNSTLKSFGDVTNIESFRIYINGAEQRGEMVGSQQIAIKCFENEIYYSKGTASMIL